MTDLFDTMNASPAFDLRVLYLEPSAPDTYWTQDTTRSYAKVLDGSYKRFLGARLHHNPNILAELAANIGDITVVLGYAGFSQQRVARWLCKHKKPWVFMGEVPGLESRGWLGRKLRSIAQNPIRSAAGVSAVGSHAAKYYTSLTEGRVPVASIPYVCNLTSFASNNATSRESTFNFLYCGQLIYRKGCDLLLKAFERVAFQYETARLTLVGEGPWRSELIKEIPSSLSNRIEFSGFQQPNKLPNFFRRADAFVFPSRHDGWGVVVNQAIGASLPVITTRAVGASHDLVEDGRNGFVVESENVEQLANAMEMFLKSKSLAATFGDRSREIAKKITPEAATQDWHTLLSESLDSSARSITHN